MASTACMWVTFFNAKPMLPYSVLGKVKKFQGRLVGIFFKYNYFELGGGGLRSSILEIICSCESQYKIARSLQINMIGRRLMYKLLYVDNIKYFFLLIRN